MWLFKNSINPALISSDDNRSVFDFTTNSIDFRLIFRSRKESINDKQDYSSWSFANIDKDIDELTDHINSGMNGVLALILLTDDINSSEFALLFPEDILDCRGKKTLTISHIKNEKNYYISMGGNRKKNGHPIPFTRDFDDLIKIKDNKN